jgi:hypothetical protein
VQTNSSSVEGYVRLALLRSQTNDRDGAKKALDQALDTWRQIPPFQRRKQFRWWIRATLARLAL